MAYDRIILHAGLSKAGSTSLQVNCARNRDLLAAHGIFYPRFEWAGTAFDNHSILLTAALTGSPDALGLRLGMRFGADTQAVIESCKAQLDEMLAAGQGGTLVLSSELVEGYGPAISSQLRQRLEAVTGELRVIAHVRAPDYSALASLMQERLKAGVPVTAARLVGRVRAKCERLQRHFGSTLSFVDFHAARLSVNGLVGHWFDLLGVPQDLLVDLSFSHDNTAYSKEACDLMAALNRKHPAHGTGLARRPGDTAVLSRLPGTPFILPFETIAQVSADLEAERAWLHEALGLGFVPLQAPLDAVESWPDATLAALPGVLDRVESLPLRAALAEAAREVGREMQAQDNPRGGRLLEILEEPGKAD